MSHFAFEPAFQRCIIASFLEADTADGLDCLKEEFYEDEVTGDVAGLVREFFVKHKEVPTKEALIQELKDQGLKAGRKLTEYYEALEDIFEKVGHNGKYYREKSQEFVKHRRFATALKGSYRLLEQGDLEGVVSELQKGILSNGSGERKALDYLESIEERAKGYFDLQQGKEEQGRIATGFPLLDVRLRGGLGSGETGVLVAPPKHGKTTALVSFAVQAVLRRRKVLYVTLELSEKLIAAKFDTNIFGASIDEIKKRPKSFRSKMRELKCSLAGANLRIAEYPTKMLSCHQLERLIEEIKPDVVFVDYAAIMKPGRAKDDRRHEITDIHEGLRAVAGVCKVPIWTAHQANRPSLGRKLIELENIAEDFNVAAIADVVISINQREEERRSGELRLYVMGSRLGESGEAIRCSVNWKLSRITQDFSDKELE